MCSSLAETVTAMLRQNGVTVPIKSVVENDAGLKGEGFSSIPTSITVHLESGTPLHLFKKQLISNPSIVDLLAESRMYEKESEFFTGYLPKAQQFCKKLGHESLMDIYPKCYFGNHQSLVFENLVVGKGYQLLDKEKPQTFKFAKAALTTLGKHHGISYAYMKANGGSTQFFEQFDSLRFEAWNTQLAVNTMGSAIKNAILSDIKILEKSNAEGKQAAIDFLSSKEGKGFDELLSTFKTDGSEDESFWVLNHGDYWNNNMLFLVENDEVIDQKPVDFQVTRYGSPAIDLGHYLFTSVDPNVRETQLDELLTHYLQVLNDTTSQLGHPINLSLEKLYGSLKRKFLFGFWTGFVMSLGDGYAISKQIDPLTVDMTEWGNVFSDLMEKWIASNPEKCEQTAQRIVSYINEYLKLKS